MRRTRTAAVRIGRRKLADYAGRRVGLDLFIGEGETIAVANKSVAYRLASHVHNPGPVYGPSSPQRTRHPLWVDLERTWGQKIHRRIPPNSSEQPAFWRSSLLAGSRSGEFDRFQPRQELLVQDAHLHLGEVLAQAKVRAIAECKLPVRLAVRAEALRLIKHRLVAIARRVAKHQPIALGDRLAAHLRVRRGRPHEGLDRRRPTNGLVDEARHA